MYGKIIISSKLKVVTGLHIGGAGSFSPIGAVDSPVVADPLTNMPIVPGSSLKGKMRTLLVKSMCATTPKIEYDPPEVSRLFGQSGSEKSDKPDKPAIPARLQFADAFISNADEFKGIGLTEVKFENTINRISSSAMPRQIERVVSGVKFNVTIVYDVLNKSELDDDMRNIALAMKLLQLDYLGGHGTRGSGRVSFEEIKLKAEYFNNFETDLSALQNCFNEIEHYEILSV